MNKGRIPLFIGIGKLIHMNGRVFDYNLGRFLSVDPFIQDPGNSQSMNPYSYIMNNPLAGTDPSGYTADFGSERVDACMVSFTACGLGSTVAKSDAARVAAVNFNGAIIMGNGANNSQSVSSKTNNSEIESIGSPSEVAENTPSVGGSIQTGNSGEDSSFVETLKEIVSNTTNTGGLYTSAAALNLVSGDGAQWKGANGKWYDMSWGGNGTTKGRSLALNKMQAMRVTGHGLFVLATGISLIDGVAAAFEGDGLGVTKASIDIGFGYAGTFGNGLGAIAFASYYSTSLLLNIDAVRMRTVTPIVDLAFYAKENIIPSTRAAVTNYMCSITSNC